MHFQACCDIGGADPWCSFSLCAARSSRRVKVLPDRSASFKRSLARRLALRALLCQAGLRRTVPAMMRNHRLQPKGAGRIATKPEPTPSHTHTLTHTHSHSHSHTHSLSLTLTLSLTHSFTLTHSLSLSQRARRGTQCNKRAVRTCTHGQPRPKNCVEDAQVGRKIVPLIPPSSARYGPTAVLVFSHASRWR